MIKGIFINDSETPFTDYILSGQKTIETRNKDMLRDCIGHFVAIVRTGKGKPTIVGFVHILLAIHCPDWWLDEHRNETMIPKGSKYDPAPGEWKYCYYLDKAMPCVPRDLPTNAVRHGRSWCEFDIPAEQWYN